MSLEGLSTGDPVTVTKWERDRDGKAHEIEIPATVVFVDNIGIAVAFADGKREMVSRAFVKRGKINGRRERDLLDG